MSEIKNKNYILEAIDQLRRRKARPDIHRICNFLSRRFSVDSRDTKADLQRCIDNEIVYKVEYKGSISYRNALKRTYGQLKRLHYNDKMQIRVFSNIVTSAIAELILCDPDYLVYGVPVIELVKKIQANYSKKYSKGILVELLQREVDDGSLVKMDNGNFSLGPSSSSPPPHDSDRSDDEPLNVKAHEDAPPPPVKVKKKPGPKPGKRKNEVEKIRAADSAVGLRLGGRRKRAKKVFDPSDNNLPKNRKRGRPLGSLNKSTLERQQSAAALSAPRLGSTGSADTSPGSRPASRASSTSAKDSTGGVCSVCHLQGKRNVYERMVSCRECSNKAHYSCLNSEDGLLRMHPDNTWQCPHCKSCVVCFETSDAGSLTVCNICADAYHATCHEPKISERYKGAFRWICRNCQMEPLLTTDIKPKIEKPDEDEERVDDMNVISTTDPLHNSSSPSRSAPSSPFYKSPPPSPTPPPTLSPQGPALHNGTRSSCGSIDGKSDYQMSDSQSMKDFDGDEQCDPTIPDATNWTYDQVYGYFKEHFPDEAIVFKEQEIDGHSLLLMKRIDVLTSLNLKLGPALKIYRHVLKLQVRKDDSKLYWL